VASALLRTLGMSLRLVVSHPETVHGERSLGSAERVRDLPKGRDAVGACGVCGVVFEGTAERALDVRHVLEVHQSICPGGRRAGEIVAPFD
jgi:hypothetical protein